MRKIIFTIVLLFVALNSNAAISQSGITNLKQLDKNGIIDLVNGNHLIGFISDGPFEGPITQTYFKDGTYETVYENKTYKGKWRAEGESYSSVNDKKMCTKNNNASYEAIAYNCIESAISLFISFAVNTSVITTFAVYTL